MGLGTKIVLIMLSITIVLMFSGYNNLPLMSVTGLIGMTYNNATNETLGTLTVANNNTMGMMTNNNSLIASVPMFGFFNTIGLVWDALNTVLSIFFAPVTTLLNVGAPNIIVAMVGITWTVLYLIAILMFLRGWDF